MLEEKTGDKRHAVGEIQSHDCEIEDGVYGYGVDKHEETFKEGTGGDERYGSRGRFVLLEDTNEGAAGKTMIWYLFSIQFLYNSGATNIPLAKAKVSLDAATIKIEQLQIELNHINTSTAILPFFPRLLNTI